MLPSTRTALGTKVRFGANTCTCGMSGSGNPLRRKPSLICACAPSSSERPPRCSQCLSTRVGPMGDLHLKQCCIKANAWPARNPCMCLCQVCQGPTCTRKATMEASSCRRPSSTLPTSLCSTRTCVNQGMIMSLRFHILLTSGTEVTSNTLGQTMQHATGAKMAAHHVDTSKMRKCSVQNHLFIMRSSAPSARAAQAACRPPGAGRAGAPGRPAPAPAWTPAARRPPPA